MEFTRPTPSVSNEAGVAYPLAPKTRTMVMRALKASRAFRPGSVGEWTKGDLAACTVASTCSWSTGSPSGLYPLYGSVCTCSACAVDEASTGVAAAAGARWHPAEDDATTGKVEGPLKAGADSEPQSVEPSVWYAGSTGGDEPGRTQVGQPPMLPPNDEPTAGEASGWTVDELSTAPPWTGLSSRMAWTGGVGGTIPVEIALLRPQYRQP